MTVTAWEAFQKGTETFNAHNIDGFAEVLADDVVFEAPGGARSEGEAVLHRALSHLFGRVPGRCGH
jgi:hypothetical protein